MKYVLKFLINMDLKNFYDPFSRSFNETQKYTHVNFIFIKNESEIIKKIKENNRKISLNNFNI